MKTIASCFVFLLALVLAVGCEPSKQAQFGKDAQGEAAGAETLEETETGTGTDTDTATGTDTVTDTGTGSETTAEAGEPLAEFQEEPLAETAGEVEVVTNPEVVAVVAADEGEEVIPQTVLHLHGSGSTSPFGPIAKYHWSVDQPSLSASAFVPSADFADPTFEANVAGEYTFRLQVTDEAGNTSAPAEFTVYVVPCCSGVHVELLWETPNDDNPVDEGPEAGSDLDLHFAHPLANGGYDLDSDGANDPWFDQGYDCFWFYTSQNWGALASHEDDPSLDRDDTDGWGPENLNLDQPQDGPSYHIGVHYWSDHGFGMSYATVRVYVGAVLTFETQPQPLRNQDMWWVADLAWPSGAVTPKLDAQGQPWITPDYEPPMFSPPGVE